MARIQESINIQASASDCYNQWMRFEEFPLFMPHVRSVQRHGENLWHWVVDGPFGNSVEWDAVMDGSDEEYVIAWHTVSDSMLGNQGSVCFDPLPVSGLLPISTRVVVTLQYEPPVGIIGEAVANVLSNPDKMLKESLLNFRQLMESTISADFAAESIA